MLRIALLAAALLALAASGSNSVVRQRGTVAAPRAAIHDGQPLAGPVRIEGHVGAIAGADEPLSGSPTGGSAAAIAGKQAGGALRLRVREVADLGVELDTSWAPSSTTRDGARIAAPDEHVLEWALAFRSAPLVSGDENLRVGFVANVGGHRAPIVRGDDPRGEVAHDTALLFRAAVVPSIRRGAVTVFGSFGLASESEVASSVFLPSGDPDVVAETSGFAMTLAAGARVELGGGGFATARVSDAFTDEANMHYGPQVDVGIGFDLGQ